MVRPTEFYYDGKTMTAFAPAENLMAVADAPPTIDAAMESGVQLAGIYFPFDDLIVTDPYRDMAAGLKHRLLHRSIPCRRQESRRTSWPTPTTEYSYRSGLGRRTSCRD